MNAYEMLQKLTLTERLDVVFDKYVEMDGTEGLCRGLKLARRVIAPDGWQEIAPAWVPADIRRKAEKR